MNKGKFNIKGIVDNKGNFMSADTETMNNFFFHNKNCLVIGQFEVFDQNNPKALNGYYYGYIVPTFTQLFLSEGTIYSDAQTEVVLRNQIPVTWKDDFDILTGKYKRSYRKFTELNQWNKLIYLSELKRIALEMFEYIIN